jgi:peptidyl-tRNA hydrolase, PTH1 family
MKIIVGLGNPGKEYIDTRHNIGFEIVEKIKNDWNFSPWEFNKKFNAEISTGDYKLKTTNQKLLLIKPQTFMNLSGEAVQSILAFYKLVPDDIIVIHDDLDIPVGKYKIATDSSSAGHHGVEDIIEKIGTQKFKRVRIGIGEAAKENTVKCRLGAHDYVLDKFSEDETKKIADIEPAILNELKKLL